VFTGATTLGTFLALLIVPAGEQPLWANAPLAGLAQHLAAPSSVRVLLAVALAAAAVLILGPAARAAFGDTEQMLHRASSDGTLPSGLASLHTRFGTPAHAADVTVLAMALVVLATGGRVAWLARAYGMAIAVMLVLMSASLIRLRWARQGTIPFKARGNVRSSGREIPVGLFAVAVVVSASGLAIVLSGDVATIATLMFITLLTAWFTAAVPKTARVEARADESSFDLLLAAELSPDQIEARPGNVLVPVRNPHFLAHVVAALQTSGDRDVVVMTARMLDVDVSEESAGQTKPTAYERRLLSDVVALAERVGRPVRLLIVPTRNVVEAIVGTVIRLRSSDVYVGESSTLSAEDHSVNYARRRGAMGNAQRLAAAVPAQAAGIRSGRIFGAVRGYAGGRHRTRVVFFGRVDRLERHNVQGATCCLSRATCRVLRLNSLREDPV
jgi:hypothetical protein